MLVSMMCGKSGNVMEGRYVASGNNQGISCWSQIEYCTWMEMMGPTDSVGVAWKQMLRESCGDGNRCDETLVGM